MTIWTLFVFVIWSAELELGLKVSPEKVEFIFMSDQKKDIERYSFFDFVAIFWKVYPYQSSAYKDKYVHV